MADGQKTPLAASLNRLSERKINDAMQLVGKALPASVVAVTGSIVTVKFEVDSNFNLPQVTLPLFGPEYIRYPIQEGDKGFVVPCDVFLGGMSGLGSGIAALQQAANLSSLVFFPIGNTDWSDVDPNAVTIYGPNGVVLRDGDNRSSIVLLPESITINGEDFVNIVSDNARLTLYKNGNFQLVGSGAGLISGNAVSISDGSFHTSPAIMNAAWAALVIWLNTHTHSSSGSGPPTTPFSGGSIAPT